MGYFIAFMIGGWFGIIGTALMVAASRSDKDFTPTLHARWEPSNIEGEGYKCSKCGGVCWYYDCTATVARSKYCPNCGAKMVGELDVYS